MNKCILYMCEVRCSMAHIHNAFFIACTLLLAGIYNINIIYDCVSFCWTLLLFESLFEGGKRDDDRISHFTACACNLDCSNLNFFCVCAAIVINDYCRRRQSQHITCAYQDCQRHSIRLLLSRLVGSSSFNIQFVVALEKAPLARKRNEQQKRKKNNIGRRTC